MARQPARLAGLDHPSLHVVTVLAELHASLLAALERGLAATGELPLQWLDVLVRLARARGRRLRMSDLAAQTTLSPSGLTRVVDRLEAAGLVQRESCDDDRRGAFAVLTPAGAEQLAAALPGHLALVDRVLAAAFDDDERSTFVRLAEELRAAVDPVARVAG